MCTQYVASTKTHTEISCHKDGGMGGIWSCSVRDQDMSDWEQPESQGDYSGIHTLLFSVRKSGEKVGECVKECNLD